MLELEGWGAKFHAIIPIMHLSALKDLRSTFELGSKDINILGKAIFLGRLWVLTIIWLHCTVEHARSYETMFTIRSIQLTIITKPSTEKKTGPVLAWPAWPAPAALLLSGLKKTMFLCQLAIILLQVRKNYFLKEMYFFLCSRWISYPSGQLTY